MKYTYTLKAEININENTSYGVAHWRNPESNKGPIDDTISPEGNVHIYDHIMQ